MKRSDERIWKASVSDGLGTGRVWIEDGYGRPVSTVVHVVGVHTATEAISAARAEGNFPQVLVSPSLPSATTNP